MDIVAADSHARQISSQFLRHTLRQCRHQNTFVHSSTLCDLLHQIVDLVQRRTHLDNRIEQACRTDHLVHHDPFALFQFIVGRCRTHVNRQRSQRLELIKRQRTVIHRCRQTETIIHQILLTGIIASVHRPYLRDRHVALVNHQQKVFREIIEQTERPFTRLATVKIAGIVLDTGAMPQLAYHFQIKRDTLVQTFRLVRLADFPQEIHLRPQIDIDLPDSGIDTFLGGHEKVGRINVQFILLVYLLPGLRVERRNAIHLIVPELNTVGCPIKSFDSRKDIDRIPVYTKAAPVELYLIIDIKGIHETAQQFIPVYPHPLLQMHHFLSKGCRVRHTIQAGDRRNDNNILPPRQQ